MPYKERKKPKAQYTPRDWSQYNKSLRRRGIISLYFPEGNLLTTLVNLKPYTEGVSGQQPTYTRGYK